jgi:hypothetical protein
MDTAEKTFSTDTVVPQMANDLFNTNNCRLENSLDTKVWLRANRGIKKHEELGYSYGRQYPLSGQVTHVELINKKRLTRRNLTAEQATVYRLHPQRRFVVVSGCTTTLRFVSEGFV